MTKKCECCYCMARRGLSAEECDWIDIKDNLPPDGLRVLVFEKMCAPLFDETPEHYSLGIAFRRKGVWFNEQEVTIDLDEWVYKRARHTMITHWRPLPVPPTPYVAQRLILTDSVKEAPISSSNWNHYYSWPSQTQLRHLILNSPFIGLDKAIKKEGKKHMIDADEFFKWVRNNQDYKAKLDEMDL